jgi:oxygen-independent coproporphyrinogen-3 oxidase
MLNEAQTRPTIVPHTGMGLYLHVPFCETKCPYCDFNTYQGIEILFSPYVEALTTELGLWGRVLRRPSANTVFLGGGTPSYLPDGYVGRMIDAARDAFDLAPGAEVTVEANPDDLDIPACRKLLSQGVNRLSIGVQSLDDGLLSLLGRRHGASDARAAYRSARTAGFTNISLDLMYGLPRQTMAQWRQTIQGVLSLSPDHVSAYCLTLEEGTPLHRWVQEGKLPKPDDDLAADMYDWAAGALAAAGYQHYEISNWALPGFRAKHNLGYWLNRPYLGAGPGAHSRLGNYRFWEVASPRAYISGVKRWEAASPAPFLDFAEAELGTVSTVAGQEYIDLDTACAETMILGLRLLDGMDLAEASAQAGADLAQRYQPQLQELTGLGLLERANGRVRLTRPAYLVANQVFTRFVG